MPIMIRDSRWLIVPALIPLLVALAIAVWMFYLLHGSSVECDRRCEAAGYVRSDLLVGCGGSRCVCYDGGDLDGDWGAK